MKQKEIKEDIVIRWSTIYKDKFIWPIKMDYKAEKFEMNEFLCF